MVALCDVSEGGGLSKQALHAQQQRIWEKCHSQMGPGTVSLVVQQAKHGRSHSAINIVSATVAVDLVKTYMAGRHPIPETATLLVLQKALKRLVSKVCGQGILFFSLSSLFGSVWALFLAFSLSGFLALFLALFLA